MDKSDVTKSPTADQEEKILDFWKSHKVFQKSIENRASAPVFSFYDGPPFANGQPHFGHSLVTGIKDAVGRYKTMRGYKVERRNGWDCHGLPVEFAIERQFNISGKKQILELGLDKFNQACRDSVFKYKTEWELFFERIGRWTDTEHSYATIDTNYTESVWWVLRQIHDKGLLYRSYKSMPYCPRCETPLSNFEVNEGYRDDVKDPSLFVKFKLKDEDIYLLGWTTTPWSLPGNAAIAVKGDEVYVHVLYIDEDSIQTALILAKARLDVLEGIDYQVVKELKGCELVGREYEPVLKVAGTDKLPGRENLYKIWDANFVSIEDGTGVLHVAPAFGEDDLRFGIEHNIPVIQTVDASGHIKSGVDLTEIHGLFFKTADRHIIEHLTKRNLVFAAEDIKHTYPFCYRCESPLLYYAISTWFVKVPDIKDKLLTNAETINWTPEHIKDGRFGKWLEGARDWAISRNRYWGAPMPIWVNKENEQDYLVVGSIEELKQLAVDNVKVDDLHRPYIDDVIITKDGKQYQRVEEVLDCWFESGSMPIAQCHYPFENKGEFENSFPADYVGEGLDQTRLWFYVQHVIATILFDKPAYKNVLVNGMIMAADGQKLSKRLKNYPDINEVFDNEGADSLRLYLLSNYQAMGADYARFDRNSLKHINRNVLDTLGNSLRFFKMYADIDKWPYPKTTSEPESANELDRWIVARLNQTVATVTKEADDYRLAYAINPVFELIDDLSNWYIRRSRRRFWKSDDDADKLNAYATLYYCLMRISQLLAPWAPFTAEKLWQELSAGTDNPQSVHLSDWPDAGSYSEETITDMSLVRGYINEGLNQRAAASIKVRQPLKEVRICHQGTLGQGLIEIIKEELNVKDVVVSNTGDEVVLDTTITETLKLEGLMRDIVRQVQESRKKSGLKVDDRIALLLDSSDEETQRAISAHKDVIYSETLAVSDAVGQDAKEYTVLIDGKNLGIKLQKA